MGAIKEMLEVHLDKLTESAQPENTPRVSAFNPKVLIPLIEV